MGAFALGLQNVQNDAISRQRQLEEQQKQAQREIQREIREEQNRIRTLLKQQEQEGRNYYENMMQKVRGELEQGLPLQQQIDELRMQINELRSEIYGLR